MYTNIHLQCMYSEVQLKINERIKVFVNLLKYTYEEVKLK